MDIKYVFTVNTQCVSVYEYNVFVNTVYVICRIIYVI